MNVSRVEVSVNGTKSVGIDDEAIEVKIICVVLEVDGTTVIVVVDEPVFNVCDSPASVVVIVVVVKWGIVSVDVDVEDDSEVYEDDEKEPKQGSILVDSVDISDRQTGIELVSSILSVVDVTYELDSYVV